MPDVKLYQRRTFDPDKHCGAPKDRSVEGITAKIERGEERLAAIRAGFNGDPTVVELTRIKRIGGRVAFYKQELGKIIAHGPDDRPCMNRKGMKSDTAGRTVSARASRTGIWTVRRGTRPGIDGYASAKSWRRWPLPSTTSWTWSRS